MVHLVVSRRRTKRGTEDTLRMVGHWKTEGIEGPRGYWGTQGVLEDTEGVGDTESDKGPDVIP